MILYKTKYYTQMSHYTNSDGMLSIVKDGFKNIKNQHGGISFFKTSEDALRNDSRYDLSRVFHNIWKRDLRISDKVKKAIQSLPEDVKKDIQRYNRMGREDVSTNIIRDALRERGFKVPSTERYGINEKTSDILTNYDNGSYLYSHGNIFTDGRRAEEFDHWNLSNKNRDKDGRPIYTPGSKTERELLEADPTAFDKEIGDLTFYKDSVTFPAGYKQASQIQGLGRGLELNYKPVYRMTVDTKNPVNDIYGVYRKGLGYRVEPENILQETRKIEIPRGMAKGSFKWGKKGYLLDYNKINDPSFYNLEDEYTKEVVKSLEEKSKKLFRSRGKKK